MVFKPNFRISRSKIISSKDTDGKEKFNRMLTFLLVDEKGIFYKIVLWRIQSFLHTAECLAYFETQPSNKVLEEFSGTFCTLYSRKLCFEKEIYNVFTSQKYIVFLRRFKHLEISFSARLEICVGFCHLLLINWFYLCEPIHEPVDSVTRIAFKN